MIFLNDSLRSSVNVWLVSAVNDYQLLKVGQNCNRHGGVPSVEDDLEAIVSRREVSIGFLGFNKEPRVAQVWGYVEGIVRTPL